MGYRRIAIFWLLAPGVLCSWAQQSQRPPAPATPLSDVKIVDPEKQADRPLTADEERERAIRRYDPLNRDDPSARGDEKRESGASQPQQREMPAPRPLPGSVAASSQQGFLDPRVQGPKVIDGNGPENVAQDYTGPAVLSRSYTLSRPSVPQTILSCRLRYLMTLRWWRERIPA